MEISTKRRKVALNWQTTESDRISDRRLICHVEAHRKKTLAEIINYVNNILTRQLSSRMVWRHLRFCAFTRRKIWKQTVMSRVNRAHHVFWCKQKLSWKRDDWKSVEFTEETWVVIGQGTEVKLTFGEHHTKSAISNDLRGSNSRNISPCSGAVFDMKEWVL